LEGIEMENEKGDLAKTGKIPLRERLRWISIEMGLRTLSYSLKHQARKDEWLSRALKEFEGVYRFESGDKRLYRYLILKDGRVFVQKEFKAKPDFLFTLYQPDKLKLRGRGDSVLEIVIGNKIGQSGNLYYLYQFAFIISLLERSLRRKKFKQGDKN